MPRIPGKAATPNNSAAVLNAVRNDIGGTYAEQIPVAYAPGDRIRGRSITTSDALARLHEIGNALRVYQPHQNSFLNALVNRIAWTIISSRLYENPWKVFKKGYIELGETVEEIFVNIAEAHQFDPETGEREVFKRELPDVRAAFHTMNYQKFYKVTVSEEQLRTAFLSWNGITDLISKIIESLVTSANYHEFIMMKYLIAKALLNGNIKTLTGPQATLDNADSIVSAMRNLSLNLQYMGEQYNEAGVTTYTDPSSQIVIMTNAFSSVIDVGSLARAFNLDYVKFIGNTVGVNSFSFTPAEGKILAKLINLDDTVPVFTEEETQLLESVEAIVCDSGWFMIFDNLEKMEQFPNPQNMEWQHWLHTWKTFSYSPFANCVALTTSDSTITSVAITPSTVATGTIPTTGGSMQFKSEVTGTGFVNDSVAWSVTSNQPAFTSYSISDTGLLSVGNHSDITDSLVLTVKAASVEDSSKSATAAVTLV